MSASSPSAGVTIVTQTRVRAGAEDAFSQFQARISAEITGQSGFIEQSVLPPNPPVQVDWVILQRFATMEAATAWLHSEQRLALVAEVQPILSGVDDVHLVRDSGRGALPSPVSAVITTRVRPGCEDAYRRWEQRIAAAQARSPGFQGYRFEPPIPGVQECYLAILRFESEAALQGWMNSPERQALIAEAEELTDTVQTRVVRSGFSQWFAPEEQARGAVWKQNMIVLLLLYPVVFLFGVWVQTPLLMRGLGLPFWLALFIGNVASVLLLNYLVPWAVHGFRWWLFPAHSRRTLANVGGTLLILCLYGAWLLIFSRI